MPQYAKDTRPLALECSVAGDTRHAHAPAVVLNVMLDAWTPALYARLQSPSDLRHADLDAVLEKLEALSRFRQKQTSVAPIVVPQMCKAKENLDEVDGFYDGWLRKTGTDERAGLPLSGHGHEHVEGPHSGVPATFKGGDVSGHLELKLHDDKGDLELWLGLDATMSKQFDLPLAATIEIEFIDVGGRKVTLRPRNQQKNEDEDGNPNVRDGKTNYFIYPTQENEDASWLKGKQFQSILIVRFSRDGSTFVSEEFVLKPHVH